MKRRLKKIAARFSKAVSGTALVAVLAVPAGAGAPGTGCGDSSARQGAAEMNQAGAQRAAEEATASPPAEKEKESTGSETTQSGIIKPPTYPEAPPRPALPLTDE